ncbi:MAG: DUF3380 domain-containing protein [Rhodobacteraceae bacterium]|nr:MAG: DUF3380 domain-containing protein [Paracoccaceae bacterium]
MFPAFVENEIRAVAAARGIEAASLLAVVEIESGGRALYEIDGRLMPAILYEFHVFHRRLRPEARATAMGAGLAAPRWGQLPYPRTMRERYALLARAQRIDREAAFAACSWGVGQVLGENARWLGFESAEALAEEAMSGVAGQVRLMLRFIERRGLEDALARRDWTAFALGYNGPLQARHNYAGRLAQARARWAGRKPAAQSAVPLTVGARGGEVRRLQTALNAAGARLVVDGDFGPATRAAVLAFQTDQGLVRDGIAGPATWRRLHDTGAAQAA